MNCCYKIFDNNLEKVCPPYCSTKQEGLCPESIKKIENNLPKKKQVILTLTDLNDIQKVFLGLENLFSEILLYYADTNEETLYMFTYTISTYFDLVKLALENVKKEIEEENKNEP